MIPGIVTSVFSAGAAVLMLCVSWKKLYNEDSREEWYICLVFGRSYQPKPKWFSMDQVWCHLSFTILSSCLLCPFSVHILTYISHKIVHLNDPSFGISFLCSLVQIPSLLFSWITPSFSCCLYYLLFPLPLFPSDGFLCSIVSTFLSFSVMFFTSKLKILELIYPKCYFSGMNISLIVTKVLR